MSLHIIILAAGQGKRMLSSLPKVLHPIAKTPMLLHVLRTAKQLNPEQIHVVYGFRGEEIMAAVRDETIDWVIQPEQLGTGHAVLQALPKIPKDAKVLILYGDVPLIRAQTLEPLIKGDNALHLLVATVANPFGLGRVVRDAKGAILRVVEEKDATVDERKLHEIYSGICAVDAAHLLRWLPEMNPHNAQKEYYLTDIIAMASREGLPIEGVDVASPDEVLGVNTALQRHQVERLWQQREATSLVERGVHIADINRLDIRGTLTCGENVSIDINVVFEGDVTIGSHSTIGPHCVLTNTTVGSHCIVHPHCVIEGATIGDESSIGPFARLRPDTVLQSHCKIGNFVETKNMQMGNHSKANHLSYLGDATLGQHVNIGAGTITCNYDGANKHRTTIEDGVFVGSDTQFVAPVTIGKDATIGAGSTIRRNVPAGELTITESSQTVIMGWARPKKREQDK